MFESEEREREREERDRRGVGGWVTYRVVLVHVLEVVRGDEGVVDSLRKRWVGG